MSDEPEATTDSAPPAQPWEFVGAAPTIDQVRALLESLPPIYGLQTVDFIDYVQALDQSKKVKIQDAQGRDITQSIKVWVCYMSVAGRVAMVNQAAQLNGWRVDFVPEPVTPTGVPGMIEIGDRIVYREYVDISFIPDMYPDSEEGAPLILSGVWDGKSGPVTIALGRRPGTAWVPYSGGSAAAGSNPYEKVETSARGRALAAWGFGVLPGSGIASLDEMNQQAQNKVAAARGGGAAARLPRDQMISQCQAKLEEFRQESGQTMEQMIDIIGPYLAGIGVPDPINKASGQVNWTNLRDGHLSMFLNRLKEELGRIVAQQFGIDT